MITSDAFFEALIAADVFRSGERIRRVVIDAQAGWALKVYVERLGDDRILSVIPTLDGIEVSEESRDAEAAQ